MLIRYGVVKGGGDLRGQDDGVARWAAIEGGSLDGANVALAVGTGEGW